MFRSIARRWTANSTARVISCRVWGTPGTDCSEPVERLAEPLPWIQPLLLSGVDHPLLALLIGHLACNCLEPARCLAEIADSSPQLSDQVGKDCPLFSRNSVVSLECFLEHP